MGKEVIISRASLIKVSIRGEDADVSIETDENGGFIRAVKNNKELDYKEGKEEKGIPAGTVRVAHNSPWCYCYYDPFRGWICIGNCAGIC